MRPLLIVLALAILVPSIAVGQEVVVGGQTYRYKDGGGYDPLEKVKIVVVRGDGIVTQGESTYPDGKFLLKVQAGIPFLVVFYGEQRVPELQQLAGKEKSENSVHVTLLTPDQYKKLGIGMPLGDKVECVLKALPPKADAARAEIEKLRPLYR
jgi:hypothetical protein